MVFERKKKVKGKRLRDKRRHPLEKPSGNHGPSNKPAQHTFQKIRRRMRRDKVHECTLTQGFLTSRQWKAMVPSKRQEQVMQSTPGTAKTIMMVEKFHYHWLLYLLSRQLKTYFNCKEFRYIPQGEAEAF